MKADFDDIAVFIEAAKSGSFSRAAKSLRCTTSAISKRVARLEQQLGVEMISRTTRKFSLTEQGRLFYTACAAALSQIENAENEVSRQTGRPRGLLRVKVPQAFGRLHVAPLAPKFLAAYPDIQLQLLFGNMDEAICDEGIDVELAPRVPRDSSLVSRIITPVERVTCASPEYFRRIGKPKDLRELSDHNCLMYSDNASPSNEWTYYLRDGIKRIKVNGNFTTNNPDAILSALIAGGGISHLPTFVAGAALANGELEAVFKDSCHDSVERPMLRAYFPPAKYRLPRVQVFISFLIKAIRADPQFQTRSL